VSYEVHPFFEVSASPGVTSAGDTVTVTASSYWSTSSEGWRWRENDTTAYPAGAGHPAKWVCSSSSTCKYTPTKSGRVYRTGTFPLPDGSGYAMPGPIIWVGSAPPFTLELTSSLPGDTATRGESAQFRVRNTGAGGELNHVDLEWRFEPDSVQFYPESFNRKFAPPIVYGTGTDSVWAGAIVHPGNIIVSGTSGSESGADTFHVAVRDRNWPSPQLVVHPESIQVAPPQTPEVTDTLWKAGDFHTRGGVFGEWSYNPSGVSDATVSSGPNQGYTYLTSATYTMNRAYSFNRWRVTCTTVDSPPGNT
jgi:hypothetical protein